MWNIVAKNLEISNREEAQAQMSLPPCTYLLRGAGDIYVLFRTHLRSEVRLIINEIYKNMMKI